MGKYILKRLVQMIPILIGVSLAVYLLLSFSPGDPARMIAGQQAKEEEVEALRHELGLDKNVIAQYVGYVGKALRGDLGTSYTTKQKVSDMIAVRLPNTLILSLGSIFCITIVIIPLGISLAVHQNSLFDNAFRVIGLIFAAMPAFWLGLLMIILFSVKLGWLPPNGFDTWQSRIMPIICSSVVGWMLQSRLVRASMLDVIRQDYIRTARAKGTEEKKVIRKHALKNALMPMVTSIGMSLGTIFGGSMIIEVVFGINGMGRMMMDALRQKDIPTVMAGVIITAIAIAFANLLTDIVYAFVDPRIKSMYEKPRKITKGVKA
ncbi:MAG: ABC transporter permease [Lachnospiraceae bacterium]